MHKLIKASTMCAIATLVLSACGEEFSKSFKEGAVPAFVESCTAEAIKTGTPNEVAEPLCQCTAERAAENLEVSDFIGGDEEKFMPFVDQCVSELLNEDGTLKAAN
ncbi:hypothetical protein [Alterisphingorhabdus coralli]|uniref:Lipoprotein n=1 Tax=Alterisphingorhabdus coralli TaxID=3071408 RepID=A0AA97FAN2_9SPHN|nr:hypothetical protein [Parasphingorhabdus sp. SCSIO 66989]WOE76253.1 hypothetical protein RB602_05945 [Parasphingorhabdus sp. SCSIO 66989]